MSQCYSMYSSLLVGGKAYRLGTLLREEVECDVSHGCVHDNSATNILILDIGHHLLGILDGLLIKDVTA